LIIKDFYLFNIRQVKTSPHAVAKKHALKDVFQLNLSFRD